ncbi:neurexin-4 isoform X2 [Neocloeon triangulifer]|uniref:neurexin-4 isoform X2 n=1 Tax=Neocloeon triangulifer TaxID=2078957 RepID=UPI00286F5CFD|nr:neurexin-4 isoform X2 [Neocloeon triangulifer]
MDAVKGRGVFILILALFSVSYADDYDCNEPLLEKASFSATSALRDRGAEQARIDGGSAWTSDESSYNQWVRFKLPRRKKVTAVATAGRARTKEYVTEFILQYGDDGENWQSYISASGIPQTFTGNWNGDDIHRNKFEVPIIAQYIRINPTRWRERISLRAELYGCDYVADNLHFNGSSYVRWDLIRHPISASRETIRFRFKTNHADGAILYGRGSQGDYYALQMRDNRMLLNIDLGAGVVTSLSVGSLLDNNLWHDVVISRNKRDIMFSVDRVVVKSVIKGDFSRLNLNRDLFIGGVPNQQEGLVVNRNFTGCVENLYLNATNFISAVKNPPEDDYHFHFERINTLFSCPEVQSFPVTFLTRNSYARLAGYEGIKTLNVSLSFRTYEESGMLIYHKFTSDGYFLLLLEKGRLKIEIKVNGPKTILDNFPDETFNDGRWHQVILTMSANTIILNVDERPMRTLRQLAFSTGSHFLIAGGRYGTPGFIGCMRRISINGNYRPPVDWKENEFCCKDEVVFDSCQMIDRCNPNPCQHKGVCKQSSKDFFCECADTGYSGAVCHTSLHSLSCAAFKEKNSVDQNSRISIDVDGSGPLDPFPVTCEFFADGRVLTLVGHQNQQPIRVDGFQEPGSYSQDILYEADKYQIEALMNRSLSCHQRITYNCRHSKLFNTPATEDTFRPLTWWVSKNNQKMDYWGGALPGSRSCECGIWGNCIDERKSCNCDADLDSWTSDSGDITQMEHLPVKQVRIGDTGTPLDEKEAMYTLGPLACEGDSLFNNIVTFRISDASINLPRFDMGHIGDIYLEFKTTTADAVILHSTGESDYIKLSIIGGDQLQFQYQAGSGPLGVNVETSYRLADDNWHSVLVERNRKEARIVVDGALKASVREPPGPVRALHLTSDLVIGSSVDYRDGYVGCIRALLLNGDLVDLRKYAERGIYGVTPGCVGKCESNPCLNNGTCHEKYDGYSCDCRWTAFKGPICADEIGVNLRSNSYVKYDFMGSWRSTISEKIRVGFTTTNPKGFLLGFFSNITGEYMTIAVSNSGHLRVVLDFGFERQELIYQGHHFGLGQYHDVRITRRDSGSKLIMQVDENEPQEFIFNIKASADAQFNNIQYMYIGKNESMTEGFVGCVSRVEFDDIFPLKLAFQENGPANVRSGGDALTEDFCGVEPVTHPPPVKETRPPPDVDKDKLEAAYNRTNSAVLGSILALIFIALLVMLLLIGRYVSRHKGEYLTQEDKGADQALDPDEAIINAATGHQVTQKKEFYI